LIKKTQSSNKRINNLNQDRSPKISVWLSSPHL
jgi:hypothetical protein